MIHKPIGYLRLETDDELSIRLHPVNRLTYETLDQYADRIGKQRKIIEVIP